MWTFTPEESDIYLHLRFREIIFRESILGMFSGSGKDGSTLGKLDAKSAYCQACKAKNKGTQDCENCSREFTVIEGKKK